MEATQRMAKLDNKGTISEVLNLNMSSDDSTSPPGYLNGWHKNEVKFLAPSVLFPSAC